jgi:hypothetical protein
MDAPTMINDLEDELAVAEGVEPDDSSPTDDAPSPELSADERAVKANQESMAILANKGLLTDSFTTNLSLR